LRCGEEEGGWSLELNDAQAGFKWSIGCILDTYNSHAHASCVVRARTLNFERQWLSERAACSEARKLLRFLVVIFDMRPMEKGSLPEQQKQQQQFSRFFISKKFVTTC
jgi:hypothetical protein